MKIFKNKLKLQREILGNKDISFIPTMGGLHEGHISLIKKAKLISQKSLVSIFINPKQFNNKNDFILYPRNFKKDLNLLKKLKVDYVYLPNEMDIFSFKPKKKIYLSSFVKILCGKFRKGHFEGVLNVINRFLEIIEPKNILLGVKDFQQLHLISHHIKKRKFKTKVISCKTIRDRNGLAHSTRNKLLNKKQIKIASKVFKYLIKNKKKVFKSPDQVKKTLINFGVKKIEYLEKLNLKSLKKTNKPNKNTKIFIAYYLGKIRLIDNI